MSRYIDADKLLDALYEHEFTILCPLDEVSNVIDEQPTADVVEVVRCKDCLNAHLINNYPYCELWNFVMARDNYCSFGKRKENE